MVISVIMLNMNALNLLKQNCWSKLKKEAKPKYSTCCLYETYFRFKDK